ncbi:MAG: ATP phosphoribosyltransferase regulatory subunit, partial [Gemmatimonadales bacterium]|nr:ATP phosphoribosyltransferase regulatory subunit [Gemmatimonadales bacterium]
PGPLGDAEIIALAIDAVRSFGLGPSDFRVRVSDRRVLAELLAGLGLDETQAAVAYQVLDKFGRVPREVSVGKLRDAAVGPDAINRLLELSGVRTWEAFREAAGALGGALGAGEPLRRTLAALEAMGLAAYLDLDLTVVRGLAYYTGTVFELFDARGELRAICGGGRYDNLLQALGGVDLPALGFGLGDVVLTELLRDRGLVPGEQSSIDVFLAGISEEDAPEVLALAHELRDAGMRVEYALSPQPLGKQLRLADARNARLAVVLGPDERARGELVVKDLVAKTQSAVPRDAVAPRLLETLRG